jgi:RNA polymerase sigma-70 factor (ECF subfamily)
MTTKAWLQTAVDLRNESDFEALFLSHYQDIYRHLFRILGSRQLAEDVAQETFLRLYDHEFAANRDHNHNIRAWLYRVATNLAYNALRSERRRAERQAAAARERELQGRVSHDPAETAGRSAERAQVRDVLAELSEREAELLLLRHAGLSYRELADVVGVAPGSVGTLLARAKAAFESKYRALQRGEGHEV